MLAAQKPDQPQIVQTIVGDNVVVISWQCDDRGSPITAYLVQIRESNGITFTTEFVNCKEDKASVLTQSSCSVPITTLLNAPYNLPYGSSIFARVTATNIYGTSAYREGNGAVILTVPTAPIVTNDVTRTGSNQIAIKWPAS